MGDPNVKVKGVIRIEQGKPGYLCFLANPKYEHFIYGNKASILLVNRSFTPKRPLNVTLIKVDDAYRSVARVLGIFVSMQTKEHRPKGCSWRAKYAFSAKVGKKVYIGPGTVLEKNARVGDRTLVYPQVYIGRDVRIGEDCILYPGVKVYPGCIIGNRCILHAGAVVGSDGFGFAPLPEGNYEKIPQVGIVTIEDDVEIGANTVVDRSTVGTTLVGKGVKIDNLVQVAHNVVIGANTVIAAQSGIAGSAKIGENCQLGGQSGISGHQTLPKGTRVGAQAGVLGGVREEDQILLGTPAIPYKEYLKSYAIFRKLPKWRHNIP